MFNVGCLIGCVINHVGFVHSIVDESGIGLPHSTTSRREKHARKRARVLEYGGADVLNCTLCEVSDFAIAGFLASTYNCNMQRMSGVLFVLFLICTSSLFADDWPQWLGPKRDSIWRETGIVEKLPTNGPP